MKSMQCVVAATGISALGLVVGCGGSAAIQQELTTCQQALEECSPSDAEPVSEDVRLTKYEAEVMGDLIQDVKAGVRPYTDASLGICPQNQEPETKRQCSEMLGRTPGELAAGTYILYSEWAVPDVGAKGTWRIHFETECITSHKGKDGEVKTSTRNSSKEYDLVYAGKQRGYRISPMRVITSPSKYGSVTCTYKITAPHGDGDKVYEGTWSLPEAQEETE